MRIGMANPVTPPNGLLTELQMYNSPVGNVFKDRLNGGVYDFANHGGGVTFADDATWATGRVAITPGDGVSWLQLARTLLQTDLQVTLPCSIAVAGRWLSDTGFNYQDICDFGDSTYT